MYFPKDNFSSTDVSALVAHNALLDYRKNGFSFDNFPEVVLRWNGEKFSISLKVEDVRVGPFFISRDIAKIEVARFKRSEKVSNDLFEIIQDHLAQLEVELNKRYPEPPTIFGI